MARPGGGPENLMAPWSSTNQPKNRGRKPSSVKKYIKDNNLTYDDVAQMAKYILPLNEEGLKKLILDPKTPIIIRTFSKAVFSDLKKSSIHNIMALIDRAVGKPKERQEISGPDGGPIITRDERTLLIAQLIEKRNVAD